MARTELPWLMLGRQVRPYALAVSLACLSVASGVLGTEPPGERLDDTRGGMVIAASALAAASVLWVGWWGRSDAAMKLGLLASAGVFAARAAVLAGDRPQSQGLWLSLCWVLASAGAYLLEETTGHRRLARSATQAGE